MDSTFLSIQTALAGRYSIERELGRGGMGIVYLAREVSLERFVAIKLLPPELAERAGLRERFLREARLAARLSHPNIVPIFRVDEIGGIVFFVMAYVEGETLGARLAARRRFAPAEAARVLQEVAWALAYAHQSGIVHRDIKPENILLERGSGRALVTDFGIAHLAGSDALTGERHVLGTAHYMSPEQASGETVDGRSDLYSLGIVGWQLLTGRLPFDAPNVPALLAKQITQRPPPLDVAGVPAPLIRAIERALAKNPADRFATGEAMAAALVEGATTSRELPAALRVWLTRRDPLLPVYIAWSGFAAVFGVTVLANQGLHRAQLLTGVVEAVLFPLLPALAFRTVQLERVLKAGYTLDDLRLALRAHLERRREEHEAEGGPPRFARMLRLLTYSSLTMGAVSRIAALVLAALDKPALTVSAVSGASVFLLSLTVLGGLLGLAYPGREVSRDDVLSMRVRFWNSPLGKWGARLAGGKRSRSPEQLVHRPTEVAIGLAAAQLFDALPRARRAELRDLPDVLHALEQQAATLRARIADLDALVAASHVGDSNVDDELVARRSSIADELRAARAAASARLAGAVAAMETIRLDLLRLHGDEGAGTGVLTGAVDAARRLGKEIDHTIAAREAADDIIRDRVSTSTPA